MPPSPLSHIVDGSVPSQGGAGTPLHPNAAHCGAVHDPGTPGSKHFHFLSELFIWKPPLYLRLRAGVNYVVLISKVGITMLSLLQLGDFTKLLMSCSGEN